ncbi:MAG: ATP-binding protein [Clostridiales bacterium]|nr:ATP-binding protein [Clostridiales bacterium]
MKKRINLQLMGIGSLGILCTLCCLVLVFVSIFKEQVLHDLEMDVHLLKYTWTEAGETALETDENLRELRITWIDQEGNVLFDNNANRQDMSNHLDRPEIQNAFEEGEGFAVRQSQTMEKNTYYFAIRLDDGSVLRVAKDAGNTWTFLFRAVPILLVVIILLLVICAVTSRFLTRIITEPVEALAQNMENLENIPVYPELQPFVATIRKQHEELVKASDMRREFTANVSHELKTPLTSISGYAELIENGMVPQDQVVHFAAQIRGCAARLLNLINDIIRLSQLDAPVQEIYFERVNLYELARSMVDQLQINAEKQEIQLTVSGTDCEICANREMIEELIMNLCSNAIRYNYRGGAVHVSVVDSGTSIILSVQDTGIGMSREQQERIFQRFYRVDKGRSRKTGGTGLGLAIVKHIAVQHHAEISVKSELGKGTDMRVFFPKTEKL